MGEMSAERKAALRERYRKRVPRFSSVAVVSAEILLTASRRGRLTLGEVREIWGAAGEKIAKGLVGAGASEDALAVESAEAAEKHLRTLRIAKGEPLVLTRFGRKLAHALEEVAEFACWVEEQLHGLARLQPEYERNEEDAR